jgi:hypothetical protein
MAQDRADFYMPAVLAEFYDLHAEIGELTSPSTSV